MKTQLHLAALALLSTFILHPSSLLAQGPLAPPGAPAPTMKTLDQIYARGDARIPITNTASAVTIAASGSYYLTGNLTVSSGDAITIATNGVTLDLYGYTLRSTAASAAGYAIKLNSGLRNITIANGFIESGVTNNGSGIYSGSGFGYGIAYSGSAPVNVLVARVSVAGCLYLGIHLNTGDSTVVESCTVRTVGSNGIDASTIKQSSAIDCGSTAIFGKQVSDCRGESSSSNGVYATIAQNCYGSSTSGTGVNASTAQNCYGYSNGSGNGVYASQIANGCSGFSGSGTGLYAFIASVCHGTTSTGTALSTPHNVNSF